MKTGFFKTNYSIDGEKFKCKWVMIFGRCLFVKHERSTI